MAGQFYLGEAIKFSFSPMVSASMDILTGAITYVGDFIPPDITCVLTSADGGTDYSFPLNAPPGGVTVKTGTPYSNGGFDVNVSSAFPTTDGRWRCVVSPTTTGAIPQVDYCDVLPYYNATLLSQKFDPAASGGAAILHYDDLGAPPIQYQRAYNATGGPAATYGEITSIGPIIVGAP